VQDVIPEVGHGLWSGQWGTFKTFGALELAHSCLSRSRAPAKCRSGCKV
jgi:hypothetical protein